MSLRDRVCVLTGASSGIGRRTAIELAADGAKVCVVARRQELLTELLAELGGSDRGHSMFRCDVSDRAQVSELANFVGDTYGRCDVLINNAGFSRGGEFRGVVSLDAVEEVIRTNYLGSVYCTAYLLELLEASAPSNVVNVASMAGRLAFPHSSAYVGSKFAVVGWSESARFDLAERGISVSLIEPGPIPTEGFPQETLLRHPVLRLALGSQGDVSKAIRVAATRGKAQRVVPRFYYLFQLPRLLAPPFYRFAAKRLTTPHVQSDD